MKLKETPEHKKTVAQRAEFEKFAATETGKKFIVAFNEESSDYISAKEEETKLKHPEEGGFAITRPANLNKIFHKFVEEHFER